jgi:hypothetical protein
MQTIEKVTAASSFNMSGLLTASYIAGKISRSPFNESYQNTPWPSFPSVKNNT